MNSRKTLSLGLLMGGLIATSAPTAAASTWFQIHRADQDNTFHNVTYIDSDAANNNPRAVLIVTPHFNPPFSTGIRADNPVGVYYDEGIKRWGIYDETMASIPEGSAYVVRVRSEPGNAAQGKRHVATAANTVGNFTDINDSATNNRPNAVVLVTHDYGTLQDGIHHPEALGVWYNTGTRKWSIFNQSGASMPIGIKFHYMIGNEQASDEAFRRTAIVHRATAANITGSETRIDNPNTNGRPTGMLLATHNWNPGGVGGTYNRAHIGVFYDSMRRQWGVFNETGLAIMPGNAFNVVSLFDPLVDPPRR